MAKMTPLNAVEERLAHLIRAVDDLSDMVTRQGREIDTLNRRVQMLMEREADREAAGLGSTEANVPPPHW
jgi:SlyX protein